ncbi:high mobility group nucleosome-binding domain-containing protein 5-like [Salvelinus sp. IW2-2015]|uniref:high mobility group nucleosome-binding domain-containing protein 5-like n=1 Tax=Salvelinus sp. IW2-2015 TaxID=2691554 RepID=UPI000CDF708B|nr:ribosome biogenesis protein BOP1 homolog [Salvelinus alpinus]
MTTYDPEIKDQTTSSFVVLTVFFILFTLVALLVVLYMWLNRQTNGQYTVHQLVLGEGGARDRVRGGVQVLEVWFRRRLWPLSEDEETVGEEEQRDEEEDVERVSEGGESEGEGKKEEGDKEEGDEREGRVDDSSDDYSSAEGCGLTERVKVMDAKKERRECEGKREENIEEKGDSKGDEGAAGGEESGRGGLLIHLHQYSGSAIWSEDYEGGKDNNDVTAL